MKNEVGTLEAKNRLSELIARVERGDTVFITRRGKRVAVLTGVPQGDAAEPTDVLKRFRQLRRSARKGPESLKALIEEGRRR